MSGFVIPRHDSSIDFERSLAMTIIPDEWLRVWVLRQVLIEVSVYRLIFPGRGFINSRLRPVNVLNAISIMSVAKAVHHRLYSAYSLEKVVASHIALRAPVQNSFGWSSFMTMSISSGIGFVAIDCTLSAALMLSIESIFVVFVRKYSVLS